VFHAVVDSVPAVSFTVSTMAAKLSEHIHLALEMRQRVATAARDDVCNRRDQIVSREDFVRQVETIRKASDDVRAEAVAQVEAIVGAEAYERIVEAGEKFRLSMTVDVDLATKLANEPLSVVAERTEGLCNRVR
jgi:hypothetical protein